MEHRKTFEVVRSWDPAIDWTASEIDAGQYVTGRDTAKLRYRDGQRPTVFRFQRLTRRQMLGPVARATNEEERWALAFRCGIVEIVAPDGTSWKPAGLLEPGFVLASDDDLDTAERLVDVAPCDLREIGEVIYVRSDVPFGCSPRYRVPDWLLRVWAAVSPLSAEPSPTDAPPSSTPPGAP